MSNKKIKKGDKVRIIADFRQHKYKVGSISLVQEVLHHTDGRTYVRLTNSVNGNYARDDEFESAIKNVGKSKFDFSKLDALIVTDEVKDEIIAVLKQHKHSVKLFKEWGLGSVIEYGKGMTFLFYGPPGTGKTWATHCIGKCIGREILSISAAEIQSSEPGGANRNIKEAFATAKKDGKILFLDECDSLITSRADVGIVIGSEINTLLTEIEHFEEVVILATNMIENLDAALERRISLIIEFPEPNYEQREAIWRKMIPKKMPLGKEVVLTDLAQYKLTGGQIKNVVLQAARLALSEDSKRVGLVHFDAAIHRINKSKSLMGSASRYRQEVVRDITKTMDKIKDSEK